MSALERKAPSAKKRRGGRNGNEQLRTPAVLDAICAWIASGRTLRAFCRQDGAPNASAVYDWIDADPEFAQRFARAREVGFDAIAQEALAIADTPQIGETVTIERGELDEEGDEGDTIKTVREDMLGHRKLQVWTRLQLLARWDPKRYGERQQLEHSGGLSLQVVTGVPRAATPPQLEDGGA
jgi:hypothetical protein